MLAKQERRRKHREQVENGKLRRAEKALSALAVSDTPTLTNKQKRAIIRAERQKESEKVGGQLGDIMDGLSFSW